MGDNGEHQAAGDADGDRFLKRSSVSLSTFTYPTRESWARCCETLSRNKKLTTLSVYCTRSARQDHIDLLKPVFEQRKSIESVSLRLSSELQHLDLSGLIKSLSLNRAVKHCRFEGLAFFHVPPTFLVGLFKAWQDLQKLTLPLGVATIGPVCGALAEMTSLKELAVFLQDNMTHGQLRHLGHYLEHATCLKELDFVAFSPLSVSIDEAVRGLALNHSVKKADFALFISLPPYGRAIGHVLQSNQSLEELRLSNRTTQEMRDLSEGLKSNTTLERLSLSVKDKDTPLVTSLLPLFSALQQQKSNGLTSLRIEDGYDEPQTAPSQTVALFQEALQGCSVLREIRLQTTLGDNEDDDELVGLDSWHQLVEAVVNGLCEGSSVEHLNLCGLVRNCNDKIVRLLSSEASSLKSLTLQCCNLIPGNLDGIAEAAQQTQRLEELAIWYSSELTSATELVSLLSTTTSLKKLDLCECCISDEGAEAFADALVDQSSLESLTLEYCNIGSNGVSALAEMVPRNSTLKEIKLDGNMVGGDGAKAIATMLPETMSLKSISLRDCKIEKDDVEALLEGLENNDSIEEFLIGDKDSDSQKRANYLTALNKGGRKLYVESDNMADNDWLKALDRMEEAGGLSTLFFAVRSKPNFVFVRPESSSSAGISTGLVGKRKRD